MPFTSKCPPFLSLTAVADRLAVSKKTVTRWIAAGDLPAHRLGGQWRVAWADLMAFIATRRR